MNWEINKVFYCLCWELRVPTEWRGWLCALPGVSEGRASGLRRGRRGLQTGLGVAVSWLV